MGYPDGIISEYDLGLLKTRLAAAEGKLALIKSWAADVETTDDYPDFADQVIRLVEE